MADHIETYRRFADRFHANKRTKPIKEEQLKEVEATFHLLLPEAYRQFMLTCGAIYSPTILNLVVTNKAKFSDVQQILTPKQLTTETRRWKLELTGTYVIIASDCSCNWFAFCNLTNSLPRPDDSPVWLFDLEAEEVRMEADSFLAWIEQFMSLPED